MSGKIPSNICLMLSVYKTFIKWTNMADIDKDMIYYKI